MMLSVVKLNTNYARAHILHDMSFDVGGGEVVVLLGRNGAGKSTTMKSLIGLAPPTSGTIIFNEKSIVGMQPFKIARLGLGYVPEDRRIFSDLTVMENLHVTWQRSGSLHRSAWDCERLMELFPNLAERRHARAAQMSGGEQQMLTIARTLMGNPSLLLLDEPSEGLSPVLVDRLAWLIAELKKTKIGILLAEQDTRLATDVADRAYIIEKGAICYAGTMRDIVSDESIRMRYLAL